MFVCDMNWRHWTKIMIDVAGGPGSILKIKCYHPTSHRRVPGRQQSSFSEWLMSESQNLKQSGHVYKVGDLANRQAAQNQADAAKSVRFTDNSQTNLEQDIELTSGLPQEHNPSPPTSTAIGKYPPRKIHYVPAHNNYRNYSGSLGHDIIPEEPEHIQDILGRNSPSSRLWTTNDDGSLV